MPGQNGRSRCGAQVLQLHYATYDADAPFPVNTGSTKTYTQGDQRCTVTINPVNGVITQEDANTEFPLTAQVSCQQLCTACPPQFPDACCPWNPNSGRRCPGNVGGSCPVTGDSRCARGVCRPDGSCEKILANNGCTGWTSTVCKKLDCVGDQCVPVDGTGDTRCTSRPPSSVSSPQDQECNEWVCQGGECVWVGDASHPCTKYNFPPGAPKPSTPAFLTN
jgi:hypothetical protein